MPSTMMKSDQAQEFIAACSQLGFQHEPTLEHRWPHNSQLEREVRTLEEVARALHLGAGFHTFQDLCPISVSHASWMITCYHAKPDSEVSQYKLATGNSWTARDILLGQLLYVRDFQREKFQANAKPAIFAGYRLDAGSTYKGRCISSLRLNALKELSSGYQNTMSVPCEEAFIPDGPPVMRLYAASQAALAEFGDRNLESIPHIDVPFSSLEPTAPPRERNEYRTLDRLIKYGGTTGCNACSKAAGVHTAFCKARFNGLIRADKIASGHKTPKYLGLGSATPVPVPPTPRVEETIEVAEEAAPKENEEIDYTNVAPEDLPFSAGIPPESGMIGKINTEIK